MNFTREGYITTEELTWTSVIQSAILVVATIVLIAVRKYLTLGKFTF